MTNPAESNQVNKIKLKRTLFFGIALTLLMIGCGGGGGSTGGGTPGFTSIGLPITQSGGGTVSLNGQATVTIPAGSLISNTTIGISSNVGTLPAAPINTALVSGTAYDFTPNGTQFAIPATLTIKYDTAQIPSGSRESSLTLSTLVNNAWQLVPNSHIDTTQKTVSAAISHFSIYAILVAASPTGNGHILYAASPGKGNGFTNGATDIYSINPDGTNAQKLTGFNADNIEFLSFAPNRTKVIFTLDYGEDGAQKLYLMNSDGSGLQDFTNRTGDATGSFSADGTQILLSSTRGSGSIHKFDLYLSSADGSVIKRLTNFNDSGGIHGYFTHSGTIVYFYQTNAYVMNADGSGTTELTMPLQPQYQPWYAYSPDGTKLVYTSGGASYDIYTANTDGTGIKKLTNLSGSAFFGSPNFSPDGTKVTFDLQVSSNSDIYSVKTDGTSLSDLTNSAATTEVNPVWVY